MQELPERDRRFARYFTLTHLRNVGLQDDELQTYRNALAKLANSLSWHRVVKIPVGIDSERTILRIDIRDYQWNDRVWKRILADYPYGIILDDPIAGDCLTCWRTAFLPPRRLVPCHSESAPFIS